MASIDDRRKYNMLDADLCMFVSILSGFLTRDLTDFSKYGLTSQKITSFENLGNAFEVFPTDEVLVGNVMVATDNKNVLREQVLTTINEMLLRVEAKWGVDSVKYKRLIIKNPSKLTDELLLNSARMLHLQITDYLTDLTPYGLSQLVLDDFEDLNQQFELAKKAQGDAISTRDEKRKERIDKGNELYDLVTAYCGFGKSLYEKTNSAKYNDYLIYPGSSPGSLEAPTGISFNLANMKISWNTLENATSYIASISTDGGVTYQEVYSGSDTFFVYQPSYFGEVKILIKGHNAGGNGPASDPYTFTYFDVLPAPVGLTITLVSETTGLIRLNFEEVASATTYKIFRSVVALGASAGEYVYITEQPGIEYIGNATSGMRNYFYVKAGNATQLSAASTAVFMDMAIVPE